MNRTAVTRKRGKKGQRSKREGRKKRRRNGRKRSCHQVGNNVNVLIYQAGLQFMS